MNSKEFIKATSRQLGLTQGKAEELLKIFTGIIQEALADRKTITLHKLGTFSARKIESRKAFSPALKKHVITPPRQIPEFHPSDLLKETVKKIRFE